ncbi:sterol delta 5-6-desaturase ERG3 [Penicillium soppii]|uniref:sterol delta 5-6-desaturase ERG3 n=1 Tax=Penicillium soppii TaxID=69789 RepID=UPI0025470626|nr:sterol delta 5-6-desaturase ERG3 [Penicillium soppii]KAJ5882514.1 sterol delta 5-6-desaturase ERG3 [Penicillium soppii]
MSLPNLLAPFAVPMRSSTYLLLLLYGNIETIMSHDSTGSFHTVHHLNAKSNFGQLTTFWDQLMGTYLDPFFYFQKHNKGRDRSRVSI